MDAIKGLAIVLVVFVHSYYPAPEWTSDAERQVGRALYFVGHLAVPIFFAFAGYLFARERRSAGETLGRKFSAILVPTLIWSAVALVIQGARHGVNTQDAALDVLLFNTSGQYYYVLVLTLLFAAGGGLRGRTGRVLLTLAALASVATVVRVAVEQEVPLTGDLGRTLVYRDPLIWASFFISGYAVSTAGVISSTLQRLALIGVAAGCLAWWFAAGMFETSYFTLPVILAGTAMALLSVTSVRSEDSTVPRWAWPAVLIGRHSFPIFLVHMPIFIGLITDDVFPTVGQDGYGTRVAFTFLVGIVGSLSLVALVRAAVPDQFARIVGFAGRPPSQRRWGLPHAPALAPPSRVQRSEKLL